MHRNGLLMETHLLFLSAAIRYAVIAEELSRFNHVIERVVTQSGEGETAVHFPPLINRAA